MISLGKNSIDTHQELDIVYQIIILSERYLLADIE